MAGNIFPEAHACNIFVFSIIVVSEREMEFFDSIIRILQLVLDVGFSSIIIIIRMIFRGVRQWILF